METKFNFKSQIATDKIQSERLLALGLKKETADMHHFRYSEGYWDIQACPPRGDSSSFIPSWSLHRLIEMIQNVCPKVSLIYHRVDVGSNVKRIAYSYDVCDNLFDNIIDCVEWLIREGYFNKEYLNGTTKD